MKYFKKKAAISLLCATAIGSSSLTARADSDIKGHWAEANISKVKDQGYIGGYSDGSFHPDQPISRAEFVAALNKIMGLTGEGDLPFPDVKENDWFAKELAIALKYGYIGGYEDGTFRPNQPVSRIEAAVMISRLNKLSEKVDASSEDLKEFKDKDSIPNWAKGELAAIVKSGIMRGKLENFFQGNSKITRAEAVVSMSRAKEVTETLGIKIEPITPQKENPKTVEEKKVDLNKKDELKQPAPTLSGGGGGGSSTPSTAAATPSIQKTEKSDSVSASTNPITEHQSNAISSNNPDNQKNNSVLEASEGTVNTSTTPESSAKESAENHSSESSNKEPGNSSPTDKKESALSEDHNTSPQVSPPEESQNTLYGDTTQSSKERETNAEPSEEKEQSPGSANKHQGDSAKNIPGTTSPEETDTTVNSNTTEQTSKESTPSTQEPKNQPNEKTIDQLIDELKAGVNDNVNSYTKNGKKRAIIWTKGITAPTIDENGATGDFKKLGNGVDSEYIMKYVHKQNWYDANKDTNSDSNAFLCSGAVASNMLHWWLEQNKDYVTEFIKTSPTKGIIDTKENYTDFKNLSTFIDSFSFNGESTIFKMITTYFGNNNVGVWPHHMIDLFINGYPEKSSRPLNSSEFKQDNRGGFFHPVFGEQTLSKISRINNYTDFSQMVKDHLMQGDATAISFLKQNNNYTHIFTVWGAEFNLEGKVTAIYISDSDDYSLEMKRLNVNYQNENKEARISTTALPNKGSIVHEFYSLSLGTEQWKQYFEKQKQNQTQAQPQNQVTAKGQDPAATQTGNQVLTAKKEQGQDLTTAQRQEQKSAQNTTINPVSQENPSSGDQKQVDKQAVTTTPAPDDTSAVNTIQPEIGEPLKANVENESGAPAEINPKATSPTGVASENGTSSENGLQTP